MSALELGIGLGCAVGPLIGCMYTCLFTEAEQCGIVINSNYFWFQSTVDGPSETIPRDAVHYQLAQRLPRKVPLYAAMLCIQLYIHSDSYMRIFHARRDCTAI